MKINVNRNLNSYDAVTFSTKQLKHEAEEALWYFFGHFDRNSDRSFETMTENMYRLKLAYEALNEAEAKQKEKLTNV